MSYKKIAEIEKADRTVWSPDRGGRVFQKIGGHRVAKFSYSPFTAKARKEYTFYIDLRLKTEIESPPNSGKRIRYITVPMHTGTYLEFRDFVLSGEADQRILDITGTYGVEEVVKTGYWRNKGTKRWEDET